MQHEWIFWLDCHFSPIIAKWINEISSFKCFSGYSLNINSLTDWEIYNKAKEAGSIIIISKDTDFGQIIMLNGSPPKLISVKKGNCSNKEMFEFLNLHLEKAYKLLSKNKLDIVELY